MGEEGAGERSVRGPQAWRRREGPRPRRGQPAPPRGAALQGPARLSAAATATPRPATSQPFSLHGDFETSPTDASKCLHVVKLDFSLFNDGTKSPLLAISRLVGRRAAAGQASNQKDALKRWAP